MVNLSSLVNHCTVSEHRNDFPCDLNAISAMSLGIGAAGAALIFVMFLFNQVRRHLVLSTTSNGS